MAVQANCTDVTEASFPDTAVGQTAHLALIAQRQDAGADTELLHVGIEGPDAASFAIADGSSCVLPPSTPDGAPEPRTLAAGEICSVVLSFAPTTTGPQHATLMLGATAVPLRATGVTYAPDLVASVRNIALLSGALGTPNQTEYLIINQGEVPITLGAIGTPGGDLTVASTGPAGQTITPGGAIRATLGVSQSTAGCTAGTFTIASTGNTLEIPIASRTLGGVAVTLFGAGTGHVVSSPPGIDCRNGAGVCARVFFEDQVVLTATPEDGSRFNGWGSACDGEPTITLPSLTFDPSGGPRSGGTYASFASAQAKAVSVSFAGGAPGLVTGTVTCTHSFTRWFEPGATAALRAKTPSTFGGWSGACTGSNPVCDLGAIVNDRAVTVTFVPDDRAIETLLDPETVRLTAGAFASNGDLVVAGQTPDPPYGTVLSRRAPDGTVRWSVNLGNGVASAVGVDATGSIYALGAGELVKLDAGGQEQWRRGVQTSNLGPRAMNVLPDGRVATLGVREVRVSAGDGSTSWVADVSPCNPSAVAASPTNVVVVACDNGVLERFDSAGKALAAWAIPGNANQIHTVSMAFDTQGSLFIHATRLAGTAGSRVITRLDGAGAPVFTITEPVPVTSVSSGYTVAKPSIRITASGQAFLALPHHVLVVSHFGISDADEGGTMQMITPTGAISWTIDKPYSLVDSTNPAWDVVLISDVACDGAGHCALLGNYSGGWVEVFSAP